MARDVSKAAIGRPPNVRVHQVAARRHTTWILSFKLRDALSRLTCNDVLSRPLIVHSPGLTVGADSDSVRCEFDFLFQPLRRLR